MHNVELLIKLNFFEEKGIKHVRSAILQIKTIGEINQNAYTLRYKAKINEIMFYWKKKWEFRMKSRTFEILFSKNLGNYIILLCFFFKSLKTDEIECNIPLY